MIYYKVQPRAPQAHIFSITLRVTDPDSNGVTLSLPAWIPGSYMIRDFAKNIVTLKAYSGGESIAVSKSDKQTWHCAPCEGELLVEYSVYAWDLSVRGAHLDITHGYFNGTSLFLRVAGREESGCQVEILPPDGDAYGDWQVATTLAASGDRPAHSFGLFQAKNYLELIDNPVEMGTFTYGLFEAGGTTHEIAITGRHAADMERLCKDLKPICEAHIALFGELPAMPKYLFQVMAVGDGYGGLEHRTSTSLICKRSDLPLSGEEEIRNDYRQFLGLCSHEYFHLWNVKRIRPKVLQQADMTHEVHTRLLWFFEGVTSYYDDLAMVRSGCINAESYLELLGQMLTKAVRGSGHLKQTVTESSFDAWTKFYKQDENAPNAIVSYYSKGAMVALALDLTIRRLSKDQYSLDDVMRTLWQQYGSIDRGIEEDEMEAIISSAVGVDLATFFSQALYSTEQIPVGELLSTVAIGLQQRPATSATDMGGLRPADQKKVPSPRVLGARFREHLLGAELLQVFEGGAAEAAGLSAGDVILAVDGIRTTEKNLEKQVGISRPEVSMEVHAFRRDELMIFNLIAQPAPVDTCDLWLVNDADVTSLNRRLRWLQC